MFITNLILNKLYCQLIVSILSIFGYIYKISLIKAVFTLNIHFYNKTVYNIFEFDYFLIIKEKSFLYLGENILKCEKLGNKTMFNIFQLVVT